MNFKVILLTVLPFLTVASFGQEVTPQFLQDPTQYGKTMEANVGVDIQGSPYYRDEFSRALAFVVKEGQSLSLSKVRYNVLREQLEFENSGRMMYLDPVIFSQFILLIGSDSVVFRNRIEGIRNIPPTSYVNIVYEGKNKWLVKPIKNVINDPEATYGSTKKKLIQNDQSFYLIKPTKEVVSFKMNTRSLTKSVGVDSKKITEYLNSNGYSLENPNHYKDIFKWLDAQL